MVLVNNVLIPLLLLPFLRMRNFISSYHLDDRRERIIPHADGLNAVFHHLIHSSQVSDPFLSQVIHLCHGGAVNSVSMINFWWKISIHAAGAGALTATVFSLWIKDVHASSRGTFSL